MFVSYLIPYHMLMVANSFYGKYFRINVIVTRLNAGGGFMKSPFFVCLQMTKSLDDVHNKRKSIKKLPESEVYDIIEKVCSGKELEKYDVSHACVSFYTLI